MRTPVGVAESASGVVVVCDDGASFTWVANSLEGWTENPPIPGSELDLIQAREKYYKRVEEAFPSRDAFDVVRVLRGRFGEVEEAIAELDEWLADAREIEASAYTRILSYVRDLLAREKWPSWAMAEPSFK